jgi:uncharacterized membrane protein
MEIAGITAKTPPLVVGAVPFEIPISWIDRLGLGGEPGFRLRVDASRTRRRLVTSRGSTARR